MGDPREERLDEDFDEVGATSPEVVEPLQRVDVVGGRLRVDRRVGWGG